MGGFVLEAEGLDQPVPLNAEQLFYLVDKKHVKYPEITSGELRDRNKSDGFARSVYQIRSILLFTDQNPQSRYNLASDLVRHHFHCSIDTRASCNNYGAHGSFFRSYLIRNGLVLEG